MSAMSDQPVTLAVLAKFHREVLLPDVQRIVNEAVSASETRLRDEMHTLFDSLAAELKDLRELYTMLSLAVKRIEERLDRLEIEHRELLAAVHRLEERLGRVEKQLEDLTAAQEKDALRSEVQDLKTRVDALHDEIRRLEKRLQA